VVAAKKKEPQKKLVDFLDERFVVGKLCAPWILRDVRCKVRGATASALEGLSVDMARSVFLSF
jgi:hypothetical protein